MIIFIIVVMIILTILFAIGKFIEGIAETKEGKDIQRKHLEWFNSKVGDKWQVDPDAIIEGDYAHANGKARRDRQVTHKNH